MSAISLFRRIALGTAVLGAAWIVQSCSDSPASPTTDPVANVAVTLQSDSFVVGDVVQALAVATCAHGHVLERTVVWSSTNALVATVDGNGVVTALAPGQVEIVATAEGIRGTAPASVLVPATAIHASFSVDTLLPGEETQITVVLTDADGNALERTVQWSSADPTIATVTSAGVVHAVAVGTTTVKAAYADLVATIEILVRAPVGSVLVTPVTASIIIPNTLQLSATVQDPGGETIDRPVTWVSGDPAVAIVDATGLVTPVARGTVSISAYAEGKSGMAEITVSPAVDAVTVEPALASVDVNETVQLGAVLLDADGNPLNRTVAWATSDPAIATVSASGVVTGVAPGTAVMTATIEDKSATATITVLVPVASVTIDAAPTMLDIGESAQLTATALDANGNGLNRPITWTSSHPSVASVDATGYMRGLNEGTTTITASARGKSGTLTVEVLTPVASVTLDPPSGALAPDGTLQLDAVILDGYGRRIGREVTWTTSNAAIATVDQAGLLTGVTPGTVTITATARGKSGQGSYVVQVPVASVDVTPGDTAISVGQSLQLSATPRDANGAPLSRQVDWTSSNPAVATVGSTGLVQAMGVGVTTISGTSEGKFGSITLTVRTPVASVEVTAPSGEPLTVGATVQLTVTVRDAQGTVLTDRHVRWSSADENIATVDETGLVTGVARGSVAITARVENESGSATIRVVGENEGTLGNNLSYPVIFSEGVGITGQPVVLDAGLRPTAEEGIVVDALPFFPATNEPDYDQYYMQQGPNTWQATWLDGSGGASQGAEVAWGDNLLHHTFNTHQNIRIEVALYAYQAAPATGYQMTYLYGDGPTEMQGTDGTTVDTMPTIFSVTPRLIIQKLDDVTHEPIYTAYDGTIAERLGGEEAENTFGSEVNVSGKIVYGFNLMIRNITVPADIHKYGWWRATFILNDTATVGGTLLQRNATLDRLVEASEEAPTYVPQIDPAQNTTWIDFSVISASGGGGGGGEHM